MEKIEEGKLLYHLTKLSNLDSIIEKGLMSREQMVNQEHSFYDVADSNIISERALHGLQEYVPFHFHPYSAFDVAVKNNYKDEEFVYITIKRDWARNQMFKILPEHPLTLASTHQLYDYNEGFERIDWETMQSEGNESQYKKQVKMAECLTLKTIQVKDFFCIYVKNEANRQLVKRKLKENNVISFSPYVDIGRWFDT